MSAGEEAHSVYNQGRGSHGLERFEVTKCVCAAPVHKEPTHLPPYDKLFSAKDLDPRDIYIDFVYSPKLDLTISVCPWPQMACSFT